MGILTMVIATPPEAEKFRDSVGVGLVNYINNRNLVM